eukprot:CAMPEP_0196805968 /NCGR_PEP_ID=MMETSP1362-20130617/5832_1 /TAXON_ID=163516 /ORGANISM="Leptocylindrus danicus, Strain CCMP1856" /LENGTH=580 /DNA_ID=CAMNT_0042179211 /DNA_START=377 /DNA_END=2119 /DNA_ORIENTATION=-
MNGRTSLHVHSNNNDTTRTAAEDVNLNAQKQKYPKTTVSTIEAPAGGDDDQSDIIHLKQAPLFLFPSWTAPRDYCLKRSWRRQKQKQKQQSSSSEKDSKNGSGGGSSYTIRYDSVVHRDCPAVLGYTRGRLHGYFKIEPCGVDSRFATAQSTRARMQSKPRRCKRDKKWKAVEVTAPMIPSDECVLTQVVQVDPMGWVPTTRLKLHHHQYQSYADAFAISMLLQLVDIRNELHNWNFHLPLSYTAASCIGNYNDDVTWRNGYTQEHNNRLMASTSAESEKHVNWSMPLDNYFFFVEEEKKDDVDVSTTSIKLKMMQSTPFVNILPPLHKHMWGTVDATSWNVRGKNYMVDRKKQQCNDAVFRLMVMDLVETSRPIFSGICSHPKERLQLALEEEKRGIDCGLPPFVVAINLYIPGPPHYHSVMYFAVDDLAEIQGKTGTPFSKLAEKFFFGKDDTFRDNVFKLFPRVPEGSFIVRKAVGSTPALIGKRVKQYYYQTDRYFELVVDISSKPSASSIVKLSKGFAKSLTVDMAFGLEGNDETTLPERLMGCCRVKNISFDDARYVLHPEDDPDILKELDCPM